MNNQIVKACPNCGGYPRLKRKRNKFYYECDGDCWTQTKKYSSEYDARLAWNSLEKTKCEEGCE